MDRRSIVPSLGRTETDRLTLGGVDVAYLAQKYGTPLYIMDEQVIRDTCAVFRNTLKKHYPGEFLVSFASKAFCCTRLYEILHEEGMGADVVSGGELFTALRADFPADKIDFHGNNKSEAEILMALEAGVRCLVVDNREELFTVARMAAEREEEVRIAIRVKPGLEAHTHEFIQTGQNDSKFGFGLESGEAMEALRAAVKLPFLRPVGIHCHIGSQIFEARAFVAAVEVMMGFLAQVRDALEITPEILNLGGGFGIKYTEEDTPRPLEEAVRLTAETVRRTAERLHLPLPFLQMEPGRVLVGPAGITVYTVGAVKEIPGARTYVMVDGGLSDNPRPALYGAKYTVVPVLNTGAPSEMTATVAGRFCESSDVVARDVRLPRLKRGDLLASLATGAYNYTMSSNYNRQPRPPIVMVRGGQDYLAVRRETYEDLSRHDLRGGKEQ